MDPGSLLEWYARDVYPHVMAPLQWLADRSPAPLTDVLIAAGAFAGVLTAFKRRALHRWCSNHARTVVALGCAASIYALNMTVPLFRTPIDQPNRNQMRITGVVERNVSIDRAIDLINKEYDDLSTVPADEELGMALTTYLRRTGEPVIPSTAVVRSSSSARMAYHLGLFWGFTNPMFLHREIDVPIPRDPFVYPFVATHELAHQQGFGQERHAQFIAYAALMESGDSRLRVSASLERILREADALRAAGAKVPDLWARLPREIRMCYARTMDARFRFIGKRVSSFTDGTYDAVLRVSGQGRAGAAYGEDFLDLVYAWERAKRTAPKSVSVEP